MGDPAGEGSLMSQRKKLRGQHVEEQLNEHEVQYYAELFLPLNDSILLIGGSWDAVAEW